MKNSTHQSPIVIRGKVRKGQGRGKDLGYPTANIKLHTQIPEGIYLSYTKMQGKQYPSLTFIGSPKTFGEDDYKAETYILDFKQDFYDQWISIQLFDKIRNNMQFTTIQALQQQMKEDEKTARSYFGPPKQPK